MFYFICIRFGTCKVRRLSRALLNLQIRNCQGFVATIKFLFTLSIASTSDHVTFLLRVIGLFWIVMFLGQSDCIFCLELHIFAQNYKVTALLLANQNQVILPCIWLYRKQQLKYLFKKSVTKSESLETFTNISLRNAFLSIISSAVLRTDEIQHHLMSLRKVKMLNCRFCCCSVCERVLKSIKKYRRHLH